MRVRRTFAADERGAVALILGLAAPVLLVAAAGGVEMAETMSAQANLQKIVDSAALSGARQLGTDRSIATETRTQAQAQSEALVLYPRWTIETTARMDAKTGRMTVTQSGTRPSLFGTLFSHQQVSVTATASLYGDQPLCVLGIQGGSANIIQLQDTALLKADSCLVQSNSDLRANGGSSIQAVAARSVGAATGAIAPAPLTDVPSVADPFATLPINVPEACNDVGGVKESGQGTMTLNPGVHCGEYVLSGQATLVLNPGDHYFLNGSVDLKGKASIKGSNVAAVFKGQSTLSFSQNAVLDLDGRKEGSLAGFVLITDRSYSGAFHLSTDNARNLHGTIYMPHATLNVTGSGNKVADQSPWTVLVAKQINVSGSANLTINSNYGGSTIPVPDGVGSSSQVRLTH